MLDKGGLFSLKNTPTIVNLILRKKTMVMFMEKINYFANNIKNKI